MVTTALTDDVPSNAWAVAFSRNFTPALRWHCFVEGGHARGYGADHDAVGRFDDGDIDAALDRNRRDFEPDIAAADDRKA